MEEAELTAQEIQEAALRNEVSGYGTGAAEHRMGEYRAIADAATEKALNYERERIHNYIQVLVKTNDLKINDGILLWDVIQDTLPLKFMQVPLAVQLLKEEKCERPTG